MAALIENALAEAGVPTQARISALSYTDRYLSSPLVVRLAIDTFAHLARPQPPNSLLPVSLHIAALRWNDSTPNRIEHDWKHEDDRKSVIRRYAARSGVEVSVVDSGHMPHGRALTVTYSNGTQADVHLDQGFGTWRPARRTAFEFNLQPIAQLDNLAKIDATLVASGKTYIVVQIRPRELET